MRAARRGATGAEAFVEDAFRAFFSFIASDPETFAFLRRNLGTIREQFEDAVLPAGLSELEDDLRAAIAARRRCRPSTSPTARTRWSPSGSSSASSSTERDPPDVEGATRFASALFLGGLQRLGSAVA